MNSYVTLFFVGGLVSVFIGFVVGSIGATPRNEGKGAEKVMATVSISSLIIGAALIICALVAINVKQTHTCTGCGEIVRNTNYCTNCGTPTHEAESVYVCENCHKEIDTNYCGECGGEKVLHIPTEVNRIE